MRVAMHETRKGTNANVHAWVHIMVPGAGRRCSRCRRHLRPGGASHISQLSVDGTNARFAAPLIGQSRATFPHRLYMNNVLYRM